MNTAQPGPTPATLLTADELADRLRVRPATIRQWTREGLIPALRVRAKTIRYDFGEVCEAMRRQREVADV